jgi:outer membrane autotransporter protein
MGWSDATANGDSDHFDDAMGVRIGGSAYGGDISQAVVTGNAVTLQSQILAGLNVTVHFLAYDTSPFMRQVVMLNNPTGTNINTNVQWINNTGNDSSQRTIGTSSGDLAEGLDDRWIATADSSDVNENGTETNLWVLYGPDNPTSTTTNVVMSEAEGDFGGAGSEGITADYNVDVPAGQTRYVMWFVGATATGQESLDLAPSFDDTSSPLFQQLVADLTDQQLQALVNWVDIQVQQISYQALAMNMNQWRMGAAFDQVFVPGATGDAAAVKTTLDGFTANQRRSVLQSSVPYIGMAATGAQLGSQQHLGRQVNQRTIERLAAMRTDDRRLHFATALASADDTAATAAAIDTLSEQPDNQMSFWIQSINNFGDQDSDAGASGYGWQSHGGAMGVDRQINANVLLGVALSGYFTDVDGTATTGDADITTLNLSAYAGWYDGPLHVEGGLSIGWADNDTTQPLPLLGRTARGEYNSLLFGSWIAAGYVFTPNPDIPINIEPVAGLEFVLVHDEDYTQSGAGVMNLYIDDQTAESLVTRLGVNLSHEHRSSSGNAVWAAVGVSWRYEVLDDHMVNNGAMAGNAFAVQGPEYGRHSLELAGNIAWQISDRSAIRFDYLGDFADARSNHTVKLGLSTLF